MSERLTSSNEARVCCIQHEAPCADCPWRRTSLKGWLGGNPPEYFVAVMTGEGRAACHTRKPTRGPWGEDNSHECVGAGIARANIAKRPRVGRYWESDRATVFAHPGEFMTHHTGLDTSWPEAKERADQWTRARHLPPHLRVLAMTPLASFSDPGLEGPFSITSPILCFECDHAQPDPGPCEREGCGGTAGAED